METISINQLQHQLRLRPLVLVDFMSASCAPCKAIKPVLQDLSAEVPVLQVHVDENVDYITSTYGIMSVPTVILFQNGREVARLVGVFSLREAHQAFGSRL